MTWAWYWAGSRWPGTRLRIDGVQKAGQEILVVHLLADDRSHRSRQILGNQLGATEQFDPHNTRSIGAIGQRNIEWNGSLQALDSFVFAGPAKPANQKTAGTKQVTPPSCLVPTGQAGKMPAPFGVLEQANGHQSAPRPRLGPTVIQWGECIPGIDSNIAAQRIEENLTQ